MVSKEGADITADEAAIYDRQIRLWGMESQKKWVTFSACRRFLISLFSRLRNSNILIAGLGGLGAEVAKNLILAGIKSVTFLDDAVVTPDDQAAQFLVPREALGENVGLKKKLKHLL